MSRPLVKICGITRLEDAQLAASLGAYAVGFVFWPASPRAMSASAAAAIARALPGSLVKVGVFVNQSVDDVAELVRAVGLDVVQLHGDEEPAEYASIDARVFKAVRLESTEDITRALIVAPDVTPLVDASDRVTRGGTGKVADWRRAAQLAAGRAVVLAGGLNAENIRDAVTTVGPWAVDVSSGVEVSPGIKSKARLAAFFQAIREVA
jgi:phosphoribosylanthranilate isomerase